MIKYLIVIAVVAFGVQAKQRTEVTKVLKPDTIITVHSDTNIVFDTLLITKIYNDTTLVMKQDTVVAKKGVKTKKK
jgi:hypothetical protein